MLTFAHILYRIFCAAFSCATPKKGVAQRKPPLFFWIPGFFITMPQNKSSVIMGVVKMGNYLLKGINKISIL